MVAWGGEGDDLEDGRRLGLGDHALGLNGGGQLGDGGGHAILDKNLGGIGIGADFERDREGVVSAIGGGGRHIDHASDAVDLLFDGEGDFIDDRLGAGAWVEGGDDHGGRGDGGELGDGKGDDGDPAEEHHQEGDDIGEDRPLDEKFGEHLAVSGMDYLAGEFSSVALTVWPMLILGMPEMTTRSVVATPLVMARLEPLSGPLTIVRRSTFSVESTRRT